VIILLVLVSGGAGFALQALRIVVGIVLVLWLLGFVVRTTAGAGGNQARS
jgi:hypothetical protein